MRRGEIQDPIICALWIAYEHALQHFLDHPQVAGIADKIRTELVMAGAAEWHVVAQDVLFVAVCVDDRGERLVRLARSGIVVELDIVQLSATDGFLLQRGRSPAPGSEIMQIFLYHDVAAASELR